MLIATQSSASSAPAVNERNPSLSADGRWLAYGSDRSGQYEIWISPFPDVDEGGGQIVPTDGGTQPIWRPLQGSLELFYWTDDDGMVSIKGGNVRPGRTLEYTPRTVATGPHVSQVQRPRG